MTPPTLPRQHFTGPILIGSGRRPPSWWLLSTEQLVLARFAYLVLVRQQARRDEDPQ
jgi:hypothetical protein